MKRTQLTRLLLATVMCGAAGCVASGANGDGESLVTTESALTTTYQAENAADIDEGVVETIHAGFTGTGYVNINNFANTFFLHIVSAPAAGPATLRVRYANGTSTNRPIRITVNGATAGTVPGTPTGAWSTWATATVSINLLAGDNDVVHSSVTSDGMPNIDRFDIVQSFTRAFQAEAAADIDEGVVETIHAGFTGTGYVNINNFSDTFFLHIVDSPAAAAATLRVRYANGTTTNRPIRVTVNGATAGVVPGAPTGAWSTWVTAAVPINLQAGNNDVVHSSVTSDGMPNIDRFDITW